MNRDGPIVIAYDGSPAARAAIALAGVHLTKDREALVLAVYQPVETVRFIGAPDIVLPAGVDDEIQAALFQSGGASSPSSKNQLSRMNSTTAIAVSTQVRSRVIRDVAIRSIAASS